MKHRIIQTFSRRNGRGISYKQKELLAKYFDIGYLINSSIIKTNNEILNSLSKKDIYLEIGCGYGDRLIEMASQCPREICENRVYLAAEVYRSSVVSMLQKIDKMDISNIIIWWDDIRYFITHINDNSIKEIAILFPDPWPKNKQRKRRLVNYTFIESMYEKLKKNSGTLIFASDIDSYYDEVYDIMLKFGSVEKYICTNEFEAKKHGIWTRYCQKAFESGRECISLIITK